MKIAEAERRWRPLFLARMKKQKAKERIKINGPKIKETAAAFIFLFLYFSCRFLRSAAAGRKRVPKEINGGNKSRAENEKAKRREEEKSVYNWPAKNISLLIAAVILCFCRLAVSLLALVFGIHRFALILLLHTAAARLTVLR